MTHTFSTLSTGGFSPRAASIAAFESPAVHIIVIVFMFLAGANFSLYYGLLRHRSWNLLRDAEFRLYTLILATAILLVTVDLQLSGGYDEPLTALLHSSFQVVSIVTTTGFATADFETWPIFSRVLLVALFFLGGCAGSTAGSMKVMRMMVGVKSALREVKLIFSPNRVLAVFVGGKAVPEPVVRSIMGFFILYLGAWGLGTVLLSIGGPDLVTTATASAVTLGNIGPGLGDVGPVDNYAFFGSGKKMLMILLMWLGRLEVYSITALFTRAFWRT